MEYNTSDLKNRPNARKEIVLIFYSFFLFLGFIGNILVIAAVIKFKKFRSQSIANNYILNLAFADMLFILTMPFFIASAANKQWEMSYVWCKIGNFFREINKFASVFTLIVLSFDRYLASFPAKGHLRTTGVGSLVCALIWILSAILSTPYVIYAQTVKFEVIHKVSYNNAINFFSIKISEKT